MEELIIGLPNGKHVQKYLYKLFKKAGFSILGYSSDFSSRGYETSLVLPSGNACKIFIDQPRDLIYSLLSGTCDAIITGQDYVEDFKKFIRQNSHVWFFREKNMPYSAHVKLQHLGFPNARFAFLTQKTTPSNTLEEFIKLRKKIVCYSEFPMLTMSFLMKTNSYKEKYGKERPLIISNFSQNGTNKKVTIVYSHGSTESKAVQRNDVLVFDLIITGETYKKNNLRVLKFVGKPIFNALYKRKKLSGSKNKILKEFVMIMEHVVAKQQSHLAIKK